MKRKLCLTLAMIMALNTVPTFANTDGDSPQSEVVQEASNTEATSNEVVSDEVSDEVSEDVSDEVSGDVSDEVSEEFSDENSVDVSDEILDGNTATSGSASKSGNNSVPSTYTNSISTYDVASISELKAGDYTLSITLTSTADEVVSAAKNGDSNVTASGSGNDEYTLTASNGATGGDGDVNSTAKVTMQASHAIASTGGWSDPSTSLPTLTGGEAGDKATTTWEWKADGSTEEVIVGPEPKETEEVAIEFKDIVKAVEDGATGTATVTYSYDYDLNHCFLRNRSCPTNSI